MQARQITLNLVPGGVMPRIHCSQYDKGVPVEVTIYDGDTTYTIPQDATVYVQGTKLDGTLYQYKCTYSGSVVYFDLTIQMTVIAGENTAELSIYDSNEDIVGTCNFVIDVEESALQDSSETSYNDIPVIADLPGLVKTAEEAAQTAVDAADGVELDMDEIREAVSKSSTSAQLASGYAVDSENYYLLSKSYAVGDTSRVGSSVDNAMYYMNLTKGYSEDTAEDVQTVEELMEDLEEIETRTKGYSDSAALSKTSVDTLYSQTVIAKTSADYFATLAESWAHGQTGIRQDESVDNAMYWANKAQAVAKTTVDSAFSTSSLNPVENRVITNQHVNVKINQVNGVHGLRYYNDLLEYYDTDTSQWVEIETGGGGGTNIVPIPEAGSGTYTYDGTEQIYTFASIDSTYINITGNKQTAAGTYTITCSLKSSSDIWTDMTKADKTFTWTINKATVAIPVAASQTYTYDGTLQTFAFTTTIDTTLIDLTNNTRTDAGSQTVRCALIDSNNYEWADNTTEAKEYAWTINKAASSISVSPASITLDADNLTATLVPTTTGDGAVSYSGYDSNIITIAGNVVTATQATGNTTITATISATTNYNAASTTVAVTAAFSSQQTITVTLYSAAADTISYTDVNGAQTVVTDSTGKAESVSITYDEDNPSITFTSSVADNPSDLSTKYSKTVSITEGMTEIYVMPDHCFYWYGYNSDMVGSATAGWSYDSEAVIVNGTFNTNNISLTPTTNTEWSAVSTANKHVMNTLYVIGELTKTQYGGMQTDVSTTKVLNYSDTIIFENIVGKEYKSKAVNNPSAENYVSVFSARNTRAGILYALWYS